MGNTHWGHSWPTAKRDVSARRDAQLDLMADLFAAHADIDAILALLGHGPPERRPSSARCVGSLGTMIRWLLGVSASALLLIAATTGCADTVAGTATWPGARLDRTVLTAADFPPGVQYDSIAEKPTGPTEKAVRPPCCRNPKAARTVSPA